MTMRLREKARDVFSDSTEVKIAVSLGIFFVSLVAVSFPALSKRVKYVRVPSIVFFLGKHFGTGVILSTAFVHLLPDAFEALNSKWTGLIILLSILAIFLVEYISTAYVDHLQSYSSAPPSPTPSIRSRTHSVSSSSRAKDISTSTHLETANETTPLVPSRRASVAEPETFVVQTEPADEIFAGAHHRHEPRSAHGTHSSTVRGKRLSAIVLFDEEGRLYSQGGVAHRVEPGDSTEPSRQDGQSHTHSHSHAHSSSERSTTHGHGHSHSHGHGHFHLGMDSWHADDDDEEPSEEVKVGRRRQVVGILMLQLGIMLHSLVIGLTLSITTGPEFTTLVTAIIFHQLFEGLSLGIRIAGLPSDPGHGAFSKIPGHILKPTLATTFAITTPFGMVVGLLAFTQGNKHDTEKLTEIQGFMSAASAGMLIYAACVEMLAGDFVMDPMMWRSSLRRQVLALVSLMLGVAAMASVGH